MTMTYVRDAYRVPAKRGGLRDPAESSSDISGDPHG